MGVEGSCAGDVARALRIVCHKCLCNPFSYYLSHTYTYAHAPPLHHCTATAPPPPTTTTQGLSRIKAALADEALDAPTAPTAFEKLIKQAEAEGWLPAEYNSSGSA